MAAAAAGLVSRDRRVHFIGVSEAGVPSCRRVWQLLQARARDWGKQPFQFTMNITAPDSSTDFGLSWHLFLSSVPQLQRLRRDVVKQVFVVWVRCGADNFPALYVQIDDLPGTGFDEFVLRITEKRVEISRDLVNCIRWDM